MTLTEYRDLVNTKDQRLLNSFLDSLLLLCNKNFV